MAELPVPGRRTLRLEDIWSLPDRSVQDYLIDRGYQIHPLPIANKLNATILFNNDGLLAANDRIIIANPTFAQLYILPDEELINRVRTANGRVTETTTRFDLIRFLTNIAPMVDINEQLFDLIERCHEGLEERILLEIERTIDQGANINARDRQGNTPLIMAASVDCNEEVIRLLLNRGANFNATNDNNETALHTAAAHLSLGAVNELIKVGANVNAHDLEGTTPLSSIFDVSEGELSPIIRTPENIVKEIVMMLLNAGSDPNLGDNNGVTPLMEAAAFGPDYIITAMIKAGADPNITDNEGNTVRDYYYDQQNLQIFDQIVAKAEREIAGRRMVKRALPT